MVIDFAEHKRKTFFEGGDFVIVKKKMTREEFLISAGRFVGLLSLTSLAGYLFAKGISKDGLCRRYDRCAVCIIKTNCSFNVLPKKIKWKATVKK